MSFFYVKFINFCKRCKKCNGLLRPHIVWFHESLDPDVYEKIENELEKCDFFIIVGTSNFS